MIIPQAVSYVCACVCVFGGGGYSYMRKTEQNTLNDERDEK